MLIDIDLCVFFEIFCDVDFFILVVYVVSEERFGEFLSEVLE